jgi:hypothetical protein
MQLQIVGPSWLGSSQKKMDGVRVYKTQLVVRLTRRLLLQATTPSSSATVVRVLVVAAAEGASRFSRRLQRAVTTQDPDVRPRPRWITHIVVFGSCRMSRLWCSDLGLSSRTSQECQRQACILYLQQQRVARRRPVVRSTRRLAAVDGLLVSREMGNRSHCACFPRSRGPSLSSYARVCDLPLSPSTTFHPHLPPQSTLGWCGQ